jgi:hypothetical protein
MRSLLLNIFAGLLMLAAPALAEPEPSPVPVEAAPPQAKQKPRKGKRAREVKEAEGTEAPGRFEADTVIKSRYELNGKSLEVDPD